MRRCSSRFLFRCAAIGASCLIPGAPALCSTVAPMTAATMADHAAQVITGRVSSVRSYWADSPRRIESEVTFDTVDYLKGAPRQPSALYRLVVPGGTMGERQMRVCCSPQFRVGQRWILFVLPEYRTFPVVGLHRGAFQIAADAQGVERVLSSDGLPVTGIDSAGHVRVAGGDVEPHTRLIAAKGAELRTSMNKYSVTEPISRQAFISELQPILDASRDYALAIPAGRRVPTAYTPVGLSPATSAGPGRQGATQILRDDRGLDSVPRHPAPPDRSTHKAGDRR